MESEDLATNGEYFISIEQKLVMESPNLTTALFNLVASHYVFNLSYQPKANDMLTFLQEKVMGIVSDGKKMIKPFKFFTREWDDEVLSRQGTSLSDS